MARGMLPCMMSEETSADSNVKIWKIKKLIKSLEMVRGNGTSMISLIIPPKDQISRISKMLAGEFGTTSNIKSTDVVAPSTDNLLRLSVLGAIASVHHRLKLYTKGRNNYVRKVSEEITQLFISSDEPNVGVTILADSLDFKPELSHSDMFEPRFNWCLQPIHCRMSSLYKKRS
ncbi:unnamed protein product, partial [Iphiclides podalirius]